MAGAYGFIYITTNLLNGKKYIGQKKYDSRWKNYLGSGTIFIAALKKYGKENFCRKIVADAFSAEELNQLEADYIKKFDAVKSENYYNIADGGKAGSKVAGFDCERMAEYRALLSSERIGNKNNFYGKHHTEETKKRISHLMTGRYCGSNNPNYGHKLSSESISKIVLTNRGKKRSKEAIEKAKETLRANGNSTARKVICINTGEIFDSGRLASEECEVSTGAISLCCNHKVKTGGKNKTDGAPFVWQFYDEYILNAGGAEHA